MILKKIKVEAIDRESRFVVKKIEGSGWQCLNRKMAVTNTLRKYEALREQFSKPTINSQFQTHHIAWDGKTQSWDFDSLETSKTHAQNQNRIFVAQRQMNDPTWKKLTPQIALNQFEELVNKSLSLPTMNIPLKLDVTEYKNLKKDAESILSGNQKLMPILSTRHDFLKFPELIENVVSEQQFIGIQTYGLTKAQELTNLSALRHTNMAKQEGDDCPIIFGLNHHRHLKKHSFVSSAFAFSCFGIDVFSERQFLLKHIPSEMIKAMMQRKPEEFMIYDTIQGGFNKAEEQEAWYEANVTRLVLSQIPVEQGLNAYQSLVWNNTLKQQSDISAINDKVFEKVKVDDYIGEKSKWDVFYKTQVKTRA